MSSDEFTTGIDSIRSELAAVETLCAGESPAWAKPYDQFLAAGEPADNDENCASDDLAWLLYTSGTTGRPKGAMVTHGNLQFMSDRYPREVYQLKPDDIIMHAGPLTHGSGLWAIPITAGAGTHLIPTSTSFDPDHMFKQIETHRVTKIAFIAPTMITMLLNAPNIDKYDLSSLRFIGYGGLGPKGVRVNGINPGVVQTPMTAGRPAPVKEKAIELTPLGRLAKPDDIASVACFLASEQSKFVTGEIIEVNGGYYFD